ncbi:hypothetical protein C8F04DRAFT_1270386 [Mycena alexandri]|uniref:G-protein coupled receptors family 2 profile 2 domain-containing protein n=1 Tax=Mycena alexandri TaxID=1745969 RepID=A0AAD6SDZ1_9AGAR|nr:hypothetical protein C8F04DRAFT_1270386 [Mycena alexandri]
MAFTYTKEDALTSARIWGISAAIGACFCSLVLVVIAGLYTRPSTRKFLNRVSFRIMVYALACNMLYGIATAVCAFQTADSRGCGFSVWLIMLTLQCSSWLMFGIALNLQLVLVHGLNGHTMEKFYILGALVIAIGVTVPPLATKQYGWDPLNEACWMTATEPKKRLRWQLGCQVIWSLFAAVGETIVFITVLVHMFRHQFVHGRRIQNASRALKGPAPVDAKTRTMKHATAYRKVIIRISFYPMVSIVLNGITVGCDLFLSVSGSISTQTDLNVSTLNNLMYGLRPSIYALLAISDPALIRAVRSLLHRDSSSIDHSSRDRPLSYAPTVSVKRPMTVHIELEELRKTDDGKTPPPPPPSPRSEFKLDLDSPIKAEFGMAADVAEAEEGRRSRLERVIEERTAEAVERDERKNFKTQI